MKFQHITFPYRVSDPTNHMRQKMFDVKRKDGYMQNIITSFSWTDPKLSLSLVAFSLWHEQWHFRGRHVWVLEYLAKLIFPVREWLLWKQEWKKGKNQLLISLTKHAQFSPWNQVTRMRGIYRSVTFKYQVCRFNWVNWLKADGLIELKKWNSGFIC